MNESKIKSKNESYWKSLEELHQDPNFLLLQKEEFPEFSPSRRDFLKLMGFTLGTTALVACTRSPIHKAIPFLQKPELLTPGRAQWYATTCAGCSAGCGLLIKNRDGRPIKIEGNPESPVNRGGVCAVGQAALLVLYDGSRQRGPRWKGADITWPEVDSHIREGLSSNRGKTVILSHTVTSPSTRRLIGDFLTKFPGSRHVVYDPISATALLRTQKKCFDVTGLPTYRFEKAKRIVGIQSDFLGTWISPVEYTRGYVEGRVLTSQREPSRHIQLESDFTLTGSNADRRVPIAPSETNEVVLLLLRETQRLAGRPMVSLPSLSPTLDQKQISAIAEDLWQHRGESVVLTSSNSEGVQEAVAAINDLLGNFGHTIDLDNPSFQKSGDESGLASLIEEMGRGEIGALLIFGANPVYESPAGRAFGEALKKVPLSVAFDLYANETATQCTALCPDLHFLESWNDAQPQANIFQLTQPVIAPLFDGRSFQDSLLQWMDAGIDFFHYLQGYWEKELFALQNRFPFFRDFWNQSLHDGIFALPAKPSATHSYRGDLSAMAQVLATPPTTGSGYELVLYESVALREGSPANNPWLQELPDPVTKTTWGNVLKIAPAEAKSLGLNEGDVVRLESNGKSIELPIFFQPGMPRATLATAVGYGRTQGGKVANGVGANAYPWVDASNSLYRYHSSGITLSKTGKTLPIPTTQTHNSMEHRPIVKETTWEKYKKNPRSGNEQSTHLISLWPEWKIGPNRWGMVVDLNACTGCSGCLIGCQVENNVPVVGAEEVYRRREMGWIRIDRYYSGPEEAPEVVHQPMMCQHCENAPCETVCPVLATVHSSDGLNQQVYNRCVGTRYCANNCPYKVRRFNWFDYADNSKFDFNLNDEVGKLALNPDVVVRSRGVMEKCSMCIQRIQEGRLQAKKEGRALKDGDIQTACQQSCPGKAILFGDLNDPNSEISKRVKNERHYAVLEELNVRPAVGYLTKVRNKE